MFDIIAVVRERGIPMTGESVRAILADRKTQTRRVVKAQWQGLPLDNADYLREALAKCPYGRPGDRLWVREKHLYMKTDIGSKCGCPESDEIMYEGDPEWDLCRPTKDQVFDLGWRVRTARFMPRWASRLTLEITDVRVERVQDIRDADALAEGIQAWGPLGIDPRTGALCKSPCAAFGRLWDSLNAQRGYGWEKNPWVWVLSFRRINGND